MDGIKVKKVCVSNHKDRISSLPNRLLHKIFSSLDMKCIIQASILSKRWKNLWVSTPYLTFTYNFDDDYAKPLNLSHYSSYKLRDEKKKEFSDFISGVFSGRDGSEIQKFVLQCDVWLDSGLIKTILSYVARHKAEEVEFACHSPSRKIKFPRSFYESKSLKRLRLQSGACSWISDSQSYQALKELRLHAFKLDDWIDSDKFLPKCPVLEVLSITSCYIESCEVTISVPRLKKLEISHSPTKNFEVHKIIVSAPMLSAFKFESPEPIEFDFGACTSFLEEVDIDIQPDLSERDLHKNVYIHQRYHDSDTDAFRERKTDRVKSLVDMLKQFSSAKSVNISLKTLEVLSEDPKTIEGMASPFSNLQNIRLKADLSVVAPGWKFLLKDSPDAAASLQLQGSLKRLSSGSC